MKIVISILFGLTSLFAYSQYSFEQFPSPPYQELNKWVNDGKTDQAIKYKLTIPKFFNENDTLTIHLISFINNYDSSLIRLYRNSSHIKTFFEPFTFSEEILFFEPLKTLDIDSNSLKDIKMIFPYRGNGLAALNQRVIYLFQKNNNEFSKISFLDKMENHRMERDFDGDHNYEIITMTLNEFENHNYWTFNVYNYSNNELINNNDKYGYPLMVPFLFKKTYKATNKIPKSILNDFGDPKPKYYSEQN